MPDPALVATDLHVWLHRGGRANHALRGVDLTVGAGEIVALVGESGSGKSTLGYAAQALLPRESAPRVTGSLEVDGTEIVGATPETARAVRAGRLRAVFQDPMTSLNPTMRIGRQLQEATRDGVSAAHWLERVGIPDAAGRLDNYPHQLSGGQRQRVMIAMAMSAGPALVLADEPTTALDVTVQAQILGLFRDLRDTSGTAFLFVTHDLAVAAEIADRIVVLYAGRIVEQGEVGAVVRRPAHPYSAALLAARFGLDVDKRHQLPTLPGEPPSPHSEPHGCAFAPRCLLAEPQCRESVPPLAAVSQHDGAAACLRSDAVGPDLWDRVAAPWPRAASDSGRALLRVRGAMKTYPGRRRGGSVHALRGVDLEVATGESVALVGESGSGKSTLLRAVAGLVPLDSGVIEHEHPDRPQMVYQDAGASLTPWLTIGELVEERLRRGGLSRPERAARVLTALQRVGLGDDHLRLRPAQLSGGQRQRVAVARAIVVPPALLLCDEPVSAMDVSLAAGILNLLESLRRELDMALLFVTHDLAAARFIADRIVVMRAGAVEDSGLSDDVVRQSANTYTRQLLASMPMGPAVEAP